MEHMTVLRRMDSVSYYRTIVATREVEQVLQDVAPLIKECEHYGIPCTMEALVQRWNSTGRQGWFKYATLEQGPWMPPAGPLEFLRSDL
jgi:uncharacterized protein CbrC (UPF0167 family)